MQLTNSAISKGHEEGRASPNEAARGGGKNKKKGSRFRPGDEVYIFDASVTPYFAGATPYAAWPPPTGAKTSSPASWRKMVGKFDDQHMNIMEVTHSLDFHVDPAAPQPLL